MSTKIYIVERANSYRLSSDLSTCACVYTHTNKEERERGKEGGKEGGGGTETGLLLRSEY